VGSHFLLSFPLGKVFPGAVGVVCVSEKSSVRRACLQNLACVKSGAHPFSPRPLILLTCRTGLIDRRLAIRTGQIETLFHTPSTNESG